MPFLRTIHLLANRLQSIWWRLARPQTLGVKVAIRDAENRLLLVRPSDVDLWSLPGGGVKRGESPLDAAVREMGEELGLTLVPEAMSLVGAYYTAAQGKSDTVLLFRVDVPRMPSLTPDGREIDAAQALPIDALPANVAPSVRRRLPDLGRAGVFADW